MAKKAIIETDQHLLEGQLEMFKNIGEAILNYWGNGLSTIYIDDVKMNLFTTTKEGWRNMSFKFKVVK